MADVPSPDDLPPAYFLSLTLENVRCFGPEQTLDLSDGDGRPAQWTVLLGDNGTGKTTLLQAIAGMQTLEVSEDGEGEKILPILSEGAEPFLGWQRRVHRSPSDQMSLQVGIGFLNKLSGPKKREATFELKQSGLTIIAKGSEFRNDEIRCTAYGASRRMGDRTFETSPRADVVRLFTEEEDEIPSAGKWLHRLDYAAKSGKEKARTQLNKVVSVLSDSDKGILPDVDDLRFQESEDDTSPPDVEFHTPYGWVTIDQLSLGYRTMIAWVVDLARRLFNRYPDSDNPLAEPAVCLVDEIDLHLHPKWQRKIIDFLSDRFPNTQFIVTAHSPLVVQAAEDANIALLKRVEVDDGDDYVEIHNDMEPVGNLRVDQILTSDLYGLESARPPRLDDLIEERQKILAKSELTKEDEERLDEIERKIGDLPSGETKEQREAMDFIERVADRLEDEK
jgi:ABC-type multidrug transport system ATPase subunit